MNNTRFVGTCIAPIEYEVFYFNNLQLFRTFLVFILTGNVILAITSSFGNGLIIMAIVKSSDLQSPSYMLIANMAFADLLVGLVLHPLLIIDIVFHLNKDYSGVCFMKGWLDCMGIVLSVVSAALSLFISVDRFLALRLKQRYRTVVTKIRVRLLVISPWFSGIMIVFMYTYMNNQIVTVFSILVAGSSISTVVTISFYLRCFLLLRRQTLPQLHCKTTQDRSQHLPEDPCQTSSNGSDDGQQASQTSHQNMQSYPPASINVAKYKKTLKTMFIISSFLLLCYGQLPLSVVWLIKVNKTSVILVYVSIGIFALNASINPVIYLVRFSDIRREAIHVIRSIQLLFLQLKSCIY